jgi:hypothetical protein
MNVGSYYFPRPCVGAPEQSSIFKRPFVDTECDRPARDFSTFWPVKDLTVFVVGARALQKNPTTKHYRPPYAKTMNVQFTSMCHIHRLGVTK